ncbi:hypothetical protein C4B60_15500 [Jeotgalibacillus proteolyticus]|uniref:Uncharacterized protein n=1 Tax=Jeotgalibacillus proteolyticus TaxID=2082395 RepID=A0A2S5GAA0_9BACL|nr:hypothetical protein C4B60_15500 [Jeotgalibacillus proteolyticus]
MKGLHLNFSRVSPAFRSVNGFEITLKNVYTKITTLLFLTIPFKTRGITYYFQNAPGMNTVD